MYGGFGIVGCLGGFQFVVKAYEFGGEPMCFTEAVDDLEFCALGRVFLIVAWIADGIGFLFAFVDDFAIVVAVVFAAVDDALF